jgi:rhodanese-related sulfurtransferase
METTNKPTLQDFHIEGVKHITPKNAYELLQKGEAVLIDVREEAEVKLEYIPLDNVLYHPMPLIIDRLEYISKNQNIILVCPGGVRSAKVANLLNLNGYPNVANLDGGFTMWKAQGLPFESNLSFGGGCSCNSTTSKNSSCCDTNDNSKKSCC